MYFGGTILSFGGHHHEFWGAYLELWGAYLGLVGAYHDHGEHAPYANGDYSQFLVSYSEFLGTSGDPKLDLTYVVVADNATFFGANF